MRMVKSTYDIVIASLIIFCMSCSKKSDVDANPTPVQTPPPHATAAAPAPPSASAPPPVEVKTSLVTGKPWTTSSKLVDCQPSIGQCGGIATRIFFHTKEEDNPWIQYDLGEPTTFSSAVITNRQDGSQDRAVPLVLEAGDDGKKFKEVARKDSDFLVWKPEFAPKTARYVRLRVAKKHTMLHLEGVELH